MACGGGSSVFSHSAFVPEGDSSGRQNVWLLGQQNAQATISWPWGQSAVEGMSRLPLGCERPAAPREGPPECSTWIENVACCISGGRTTLGHAPDELARFLGNPQPL